MGNLTELMQSTEGQRMIERFNDRSRASLEMDLNIRRGMRETASRLRVEGRLSDAAILESTSRGYGSDK